MQIEACPGLPCGVELLAELLITLMQLQAWPASLAVWNY
jgi:hypothetical protein